MTKEVDNYEVEAKFEESRLRIKNKADLLLKSIQNELTKLLKFKEKHILNESNEALLGSKMGNIVEFKGAIINNWEKNLKKE